MNKENKKENKKENRKEKVPSLPKDYIPRLRKNYDEQILPAVVKELGISVMAAPKLKKIVINMGVNEAKENIQVLEQAKEDLAAISGQAPEIKKAKKSISNFKLREGMPIALRVTLRKKMMYEFLDRFVSLSAPKIRDFQGFDDGHFDGRGNYNIGLKDHHIFPEVNVEKSAKPRGMSITFVISGGDDKKSHLLLQHFGMPFKKAKNN